MTRPLKSTEIEELLRDGTVQPPVPPRELLESLKQEIPAEFDLAPAPDDQKSGASVSRRMQLLAASLFVVTVGTVVTMQVAKKAPLSTEIVVRTEQPAAQTVAADEEPPATVLAAAEKERRVDAVEEVSASPMKVEQPVPSPHIASTPAAERSVRSIAEDVNKEDSEVVVPSPSRDKRTRERSDSPMAPTAAERLSRKVAAGKAPDVADAEEQVIVPQGRLMEMEAMRHEVATEPPPPSTGGSAEPNDQAYGDMLFRAYGTNPFIDTEDDRLSTFGLEVDTGSYTLARSYLNRGHLPPREAIRIEEFLNAFDYGDRSPSRDDFSLSAEGAVSPFAPGERYHLLRFGISGRVVDTADRPPATLIFVVDISGSMGRENRLGLVRRSLRLLLDELNEQDRVGLVVYGDRGRVLQEPTADLDRLRRAIDGLQPGGSTNAEEGLVLAYDLAREHLRNDAVNRVVLCSDGVANVGRTGPDSILERIESDAAAGIELTAVGFGMGNYNDVLMEQLADRGEGRYAYVDTLAEARRLFVEDLTGTLQTIAADTKAQVEFNPQTVSRYRLVGYENRDIADERFRDDSVDAGEIGAGHQVTALYEIKLHSGARGRQNLATLNLRYRSLRDGEVVEQTLPVRVREVTGAWAEAPSSLKLASLVAEFGEILKGAYWAKDGDLHDLLRRAQRLAPGFAGDPEVAEFTALVGKAAQLSDD